MSDTVSAILTSLSTVVVLVLVFAYLFHRCRERYLLLWAISWILQGGRLVCDTAYTFPSPSPWLGLTSALLVTLSALFLLGGCYEFLQRRMPRIWWLFGGVSMVWAAVAAATEQPLPWSSLGTSLLSGLSCCYIGLLFIRRVRYDSPAARLCGWTFLVWGLHKLDYPFVRAVESIAPIGYFLASILALIAAIGLVLTYFESAQVRLKESEERYRLLVEQAADAIFVTDAEGWIKDVNSAAAAMLGYSRERLLAMKVQSLMPAIDETAFALDRERMAAGQTIDHIRPLRQRDGVDVACDIRVRQLANGRYLAILRDISARLAAEQALRESSELLNSILESLRDAVVLCQPGTNLIETCNGAIEEMLGYPPETLRGKPLASLLADPTAEARLCAAAEDAIAADGFFSAEGRLRHVSGAIMPVEYQLLPIRSETGDVLHWLSVIRDITERRAAEQERIGLEEQLRQSQKMEAIGKLAGGVAHDFNNLLTSILGYADFIAEEPSLPARARADLAEVKKAGARAAELTRQLLAFGRRQFFQPVQIDLNARLEDIRRMLVPLLGETVELTLKLDATARVYADPSQIEQVVVNLVVNARDAIGQDGQIVIETADVAERPTGLPPGAYVRLTVRDNGSGMPEAVRARVFEPFFTTKPLGEGSGLGLSTAYGIIKQSEGEIVVDSAPGVGSAFHVYLPVATDAAAPPAAAPPRAGAGAEPRRVLLVEDDAAVRAVTRRSLEQLGCEVLEAAGPLHGLELAQAERFDLLLTDVMMPQMNGPELATAVRERWPQAAVLYMSGYSGDPLDLDDSDAAYLAKPFTTEQLGARIESLLGDESCQPAD